MAAFRSPAGTYIRGIPAAAGGDAGVSPPPWRAARTGASSLSAAVSLWSAASSRRALNAATATGGLVATRPVPIIIFAEFRRRSQLVFGEIDLVAVKLGVVVELRPG